MIITGEQKEKLLSILPNYEELLMGGGVRSVLDELAMEITAAFKNDEPTARSREIERLYDDLYYQNKGK